jgi:hypothetical protein
MNKYRNAPSPSIRREAMAALMADVHTGAGERVRKAIIKMPGAEDFGTADLLTDTLSRLDRQPEGTYQPAATLKKFSYALYNRLNFDHRVAARTGIGLSDGRLHSHSVGRRNHYDSGAAYSRQKSLTKKQVSEPINL